MDPLRRPRVFGIRAFSFQIGCIKNVARCVRHLDHGQPERRPDEKERPWEAKTMAGQSNTAAATSTQGEYSLDVAQSAISTDPVFGTSGGAFLSLSDVLGNEQYYFLLYNTAQTQAEILSSFNMAISRISLGQRTNYAYGIYRFAGRRYDLTDQDEYYYERVFGGYFALSYPITKFERIETRVSLSNSDKEVDGPDRRPEGLLLSNSLSFMHDNSLWGPSGPMDGSRFNLTLAYTTDIQYSNVNYFSVIADYRHYLRLASERALPRGSGSSTTMARNRAGSSWAAAGTCGDIPAGASAARSSG